MDGRTNQGLIGSIGVAIGGLLMVVVSVGCSGGGGTSAPDAAGSETGPSGGCTAGRAVECYCTDGSRGAQTCQSDGTWGDCNCEDPIPDVGGRDTATADMDGASGSDTLNSDADATGTPPDYCSHPLESRPDNRIDLGNKGLQPGDDIAPLLDDHWEPGNEVHIPAGSYQLSNPDSLGIAADDDAWLIGDGTVELDHGQARNEYNFEATNGSHIRVRNITLRGVDQGQNSKIRPFAPDDDALVELINFNRPDGGADGEEHTGFYIPGEHAGPVRFINCHIEGFSDNGLYGDAPGEGEMGDGNGPVIVIGGLWKNNDVNGLRFGSDNSAAIGTAIVNDATSPTTDGTPGAQRGIRIREPGENIELRDVHISQYDEPGVGSPIAVKNDKFKGPPPSDTTFENLYIRNDTSDDAINCDTDDYDLSGTTLHLTGSGSYDLDCSGPYNDVRKGDQAQSATTTKKWECLGRFPEP